MKRGRLILGAAGAVLALVPGMVSAANGTGGGPIAQDLVGSGSDTTQFMMHAIDGIYLFSPGCQQLKVGTTQPEDFSCQSPDPTGTVTSENYAHDQVHEAYFLGSGGGINQLCKTGGTPPYATISYARSSRVPSSSDCTGLDFVAYAKDGISWEAFDGGTTASGVNGMNNTSGTCTGPGYCLTQAQLQGIYNCTYTNWNQVGGQNVPIYPYLPPTSSGTEQTFAGFLGFQPVSTAGCTIYSTPENTNAQIVADARQNGAIAPFSYGIFKTQVHGLNNAVLGAIDNVQPLVSTINNGSFPYTRSLFNVVCGPYVSSGGSQCASGQSSAAVQNYVGPDGWICKPTANHATDPITLNNFRSDIATAITNSGFVPIQSGPIGGGDTTYSGSDFCRLTLH